MAGSRGIEPRKRASKARGLPLTELPAIGWTGGNRTLDNWFTASQSATDLRPTYKTLRPSDSGGQGGARIRVCWASTSRYSISATCPNMVEDIGIEPICIFALQVRRPLLVGLSPRWLRVRESNSANAAYETAVMRQLNLPALKSGPAPWDRTT